jgi:hypothetical protein
MTFATDGPKIDITRTAMMMSGKASSESTIRMTMSSAMPR